jgi:predicted nucleic acid-binding protein
MPSILIDTGPLVAYFDRSDHFAGWTRQILVGLRPPLLTCEAVVLETCYLLQRTRMDASLPLRLIESGFVIVDFVMQQEAQRLGELMRRYRNIPMSIADACLVRMAELHPDSTVLTLDSDFLIYRKHDREPLSLLIPNRKP